MHISEGILSAPVLIGGGVLAATAVGIGLAKMREEDVVKTAVLSSALFVATLIKFPIGPSAVHLILNGLAGLMLGWYVFPAFAIALLLQATLFGFGGVSTLGVNILILGGPGMICYILFHPFVSKSSPRAAFLIGAGAGATATLLGGLLLATVLVTTGREYTAIAGTVLALHIPVMIIEGFVTGAAVSFLRKVRPDTFANLSQADQISGEL